ncbi:molybdopterin-guanine dinucleotide biosynthesis protein B [Bacillus alkalicellulosilyticus]|uniref:molybdopterin-guanine dinucleotide biosynthesis protein B n=1 Tax=Alkalihalobacterium alkalicellulosilyticum TaxID=1912214 RepID=UPI000997345B|nr:molybdopterin-guanine dinucleotide biosynthesis protein B [Bacillus alkalicellulosilyticus]
MAVGVKVLQFVGYSNSGKTTYLNDVITFLSSKGIKVATVKHHGHGSELLALDEGKDSWKHRQAGAIASAVSAAGSLQVQVNQGEPWSLQNIVEIYDSFSIDCILVEGFKREAYDKVVIVRNKEDITLLQELLNIKAVIVWDKDANLDLDVPIFKLEEKELFYTWLLDYLGRES